MNNFDYELLDSGNCLKLERTAGYTFIRPSPYAVWRPSLLKEEWDKAELRYTRESDKAGKWTKHNSVKDDLRLNYNQITFTLKLTSFGHIGIFPEQTECWEWLADRVKQTIAVKREAKVLNLFAYTGGSTLVAAWAGAQVTHIDAAKNVVEWARENANISGLTEAPIRWITEDAVKYVEREIKRGVKYDGIIMDPPSFGRGPQGQVFKIEEDLLTLFEMLPNLMTPESNFVLYTAHTPGFTAQTLKNQLELIAPSRPKIEYGEMNLKEKSGRLLPSGYYARYSF